MEEQANEMLDMLEALTPRIAHIIRVGYDALVAEGFSGEQAWEFVVKNPPTVGK